MAGRVRSGLVAIAVALVGLAGLVTPSPARATGADQPEPTRVYRSGRQADPWVRTFVVGARPDGRSLVALEAMFACDELELTGVIRATVEPTGAFGATSSGFSLTGGGTDEVDAEVEVQGRFRGGQVDGTITAEAEAFDNAGTTGTCDAELDWAATAGGPNASLEQIQASVALTRGFALVAAAPDAAYVATAADDAGEARLHRIDTATDSVAWETGTGTEITALAAMADAVWAVDGTRNRVLRFDAATGEEVAQIPLDPAVDEPSSFGVSIAATDAAVWVAVDDLFRIDPAGNGVAAAIELGDDTDDAVVAAAGNAVYTGVNRVRGADDADGPPTRLLRVDADTNQITADVEGVGQFTALAADDDALWAAPFLEPLRALDPTTLAEVGTVDVEADAVAAAPPGAWVLTERGVAAYPAGFPDPTARIPLLGGDFGAIAAAGDAVWVWDPRLGTLTHIEAG